MKKGILLFLAVIVWSISWTQTVLISPTGDGGFETGIDFATNGWTVVNGANANRVWYVGTGQAGYTGTRCAFIGNNTTTVGTNTTTRVVHFYKSVTIPAGASNITLTFKYKQAAVDATYDFLKVYLNANVPVSGTQQSTGQLGVEYPGAAAYTNFTTVSITVPNSYAGTTNNLIFTFKSDAVAAHCYGAIDDISLTYTPAAACAGIPSSLSSSAITTTTATISWAAASPAPASGYQYYYSTSSTAPNGATIPSGTVGAGVLTANISGLTSSSIYYFWVRGDCGGGTGVGNWSSSATFTTACGAISSFPWTEGFEGLASVSTTIFPTCWLEGTGTNWRSQDASTSTYNDPRTGSKYVGCVYSGTNDRLWTPGFQLTAGVSYDFSTYFVGDGYAGWTGNVVYNTSQSATGETVIGAAFIATGTTSTSGTNYAQILRSFTPSSSGTYYFGIRITSNTTPWSSMGFDDFRLVLSPSCVTPTAVTSSAVTATTATISWTAASPAPANGYQYEVRASGAAGSGATGLADSGSVGAGVVTDNVSGLTATTTYSVYVRSDCGGSSYSAWTSAYTFTTPCTNTTLNVTQGFNAVTIPSCWSQQYVVGASAIQYVASSSYPTTTPQEGADYVYWNSYNITAGNETRLVSPPITTTGTSSVDVEFYWKNENSTSYNSGAYLNEGVQIQYSTDGSTWTNAGSFIPRYDATLGSGVNQWKLKTITLPAGAGNQATVYVGFKFHSELGDNCAMDAVVIKPTPSCITPTAVTSSSVTATTATISWTAASPAPSNGYEYEVRTSGAAGSGATGLTTSGTVGAGVVTANVSGLSASTTYSVYVRSYCGGSDYSAWTSAYTFTTPCANITLNVTEGFNAGATIPSCWSQQFVTGTLSFTYPTTGTGTPAPTPQEGTRQVMFNSYSNSGSQTRLVTPPITTTGTTSVDVEFQWYFYLTGGAGSYLTEGVQVQYSTNGSTWTNAGSLIRRYGAVTGWSLQTVTLPAGAANQATVYVGFLFTSNAGYDSYLDAVVIKPSPSCMPPTALTASSISYTSATISWTAPALGTPAGYQWEVRTSGAAGSGATGLAASGTTTIPTVTANVTGLVGATTYTYYVRTDCGGSDYSIWASNTFNTLSCNIPTSVTSSAITTTTATISWTAPVVGSPAGYEYEVRTSGAAGSGATGLAASGTTTSPTVSANLVGLSSGTTYSVYVRTNCSTGFYSAWTVAVNFNTTCNDIAAFPWTQNFDAMGSIGNSIIPSCWKIESGSGTPWYSANAASITYNDPASAPNYIYCNWTPSATDKYLITPGFSLTAGTSYDFSFNFAGDGYTGWTADVRYNTTQTGTGSTIMGAAFLAPATTSTATYAQVTRTFVAPSSATYYFIVHVNNDGIPYDLGFDDFRFEPTPTCFTPTALTSSAITNTTATISWTASVPAPANGYQYEVRTSGAAGSGATGLVTSGNTAAGIVTKNITGLISNTSYSVYVRGDCGAGDYSSWTTAHVFTTVYVAPVPYLEPFATTTTPTGYNITAWTIGSVRGVTGNPGNNIYKNLYSSATTGTFTTVNIGTVPANAKLTFDYKLANYNSPYGVPAANSGNFSVSISTDFGGSYTVLETITNNGIAGWQAKEYDLAAYVGQVIKIRIIGNWTSGDYDLAFDNIKVALPPYWTGAISSNWATPGNWSEGTVPTGVINALITASYTNAPIINEDKTTPAICNNLTIENGAVLTIAADKGLTVNGNIINNGTVHIESTVTGDGSLLTTGTISGTGIYNVDRYLQESMWHLVTSPIVGAQSGVMHGIWLRPYDEATNTFGAYIVPDNTPMPTGQGFSVWTNTANEIRTFAGTVNDGAQGPWSVQLTGSASANTGWNLIGNPYPSAIDWNAASGWTKNSIGGTIYLWNQTQYATFNGTVGTNQGSNFIAMGQGFFVQASAPGANISLNDNVRVHNAIPFRDEVEVPDVIRINVEGNSSSDEAVIYHVDGSDDSYDFNYDATKLYGNSSAPQLYTKKQENMLAINSMSNLQNLDGKLVYLEVGEVGEYMITYNHNLIEYSNVMMKDLATNAVIYPNHNYVFTAQPDDDDARFEFFFDLTNIEPESSDNISVWAFSNILHVEVPQNQTISNIALYDMQGKLVMTFTDKVKDLSGLAPAIYVVKVNAGENTVVEKVIVK